MLDPHPPHEPIHSWRGFFIHIAAIAVGLLLALGLEQTVEALHRHHQRKQLEEALRGEAANNRDVIARDLQIQALEAWFLQAVQAIDTASPQQAILHLSLPPAPCLPGSVGTATYRYFAPSQAVWTTARESGLVPLLPVEQARMYARLDHNYLLLAGDRDSVYRGCSTVAAMQMRLARVQEGGAKFDWSLAPAQAERLAQAASETRLAIKSLSFRLRWSDVYEAALVKGENRADLDMMTTNQERFEDEEDRTHPVTP